MTTKRVLFVLVLLLAVSLAAGLTIRFVFHPDPGCGDKPDPTVEP